ncbi:MAG: PKD domain-containing protein [Holophagales bacterium]|nr:PKD domain-containing protein [Holophagales bacterium]
MARRILLALLALAAALPPAGAQTFKAIAFGDSVTEGYGDSQGGGGYPARLQRWLRQRGYDATVVNEGVGGEATPEGLARIDDVLDQGGDYFLLMEGTNDISRRMSVETIRFNLNKLAERAEARGMRVVQASVIPRIPDAPVDSSNEKTGDLADAVEALAASHFRAFAGVFDLFLSLDSVFDLYYYDDPFDPVGHPNADGYQELGGLFLEVMLQVLTSPQLQIAPPPPPVATGALATFGAVAAPEFVRLEWDFGDGGWAASEDPPALTQNHVFLAPGSYEVRLRGYDAAGGSAETETTVTVEGDPPTWATRSALLPLVFQGDGADTTDLEADLRLQNFSALPAVAEIAFFPEVRLDAPPTQRQILVDAGAAVTVENVVTTLFGLERARGSLLIQYLALPGTPVDEVVSFATLRLWGDAAGTSEEHVVEIGAEHWSSVQKVVGGIVGGGSTAVEIGVANLDGNGGYVSMALYDGVGALVDSALFELEVGAVRLRGLTDLFRGLGSRPQPLTAVFLASGIRFSASAMLVDPVAGQVVHLESSP